MAEALITPSVTVTLLFQTCLYLQFFWIAIMDRYTLPSVVNRGLHRLVTGSRGFGNLLPSGSYTHYTCHSNIVLKEILEQFAIDAGIPISSAITQKIESLPFYSHCSHTQENLSEEYLWGYKATKNVFLRGVFSALAYGELEFCERDLPQKSHEERLTGHLLSKMYSSVNFCADSLTEFAKELYGEEISIEVAYHDLSTNNREKVTGSDFGIIVHTLLPGEEKENVQAAAFQAKKLYNTQANLPIHQATAQRNHFGDDGAYTCLYDIAELGVSLPPAVIKTSEVVNLTHQTKKDHIIQRDSLPHFALPLSLFLIQLISRQITARQFTTLSDAAKFMHNPDSQAELNVSRVMTISIGVSNKYRQPLNNLFPAAPSSEDPPLDDTDADHHSR